MSQTLIPSLDLSPAITDAIMPRLTEGAYSFIHKYALPVLPAECVIEGWQNLASLPKKTNDYAVFTLGTQARRGTNITTLDLKTLPDEPGILTIETMYEVAFQFDLCSTDSIRAMTRATAIHALCRDGVGVEFWKPFGVSMCYATGPTPLPFTDEGKSWVNRFMVKAHATFWAKIVLSVDWFDTAKVTIYEVQT